MLMLMLQQKHHWCFCKMPEEDYNEEEMNMVQCQGATCKQLWFHQGDISLVSL